MNDNLKIKVCGMKDADNIKAVLRLGVDFVGFIFYKLSPRDAGIIPQGIDFGNTAKVGVFVDAAITEIREKIINFKLDFVQLHGDESAGYCEKLKATGANIIKAFSVDKEFDFAICEEYMDIVDYFLFDAKGKLKGGNGVSFDWGKMEEYTMHKPFLLSGGISSLHVESIRRFKHSQFAGIDINSGFELEPGLKDDKKIKTFLDEIRN